WSACSGRGAALLYTRPAGTKRRDRTRVRFHTTSRGTYQARTRAASARQSRVRPPRPARSADLRRRRAGGGGTVRVRLRAADRDPPARAVRVSAGDCGPLLRAAVVFAR